MYLPTDDETERDAITRAFKSYAAKEEATLGEKYRIRTHWAKIELPEPERSDRGFRVARERMAQLYPVEEFRKIRARLDPKGILATISSRRCWGSRIACPWWPSAKFSASRRSTWMRSFDWRAPPAPSGTEASTSARSSTRFAQMVLAVRSTYDMFGRSMRAEKENETRPRRTRGRRRNGCWRRRSRPTRRTRAAPPPRQSRAPREEMV